MKKSVLIPVITLTLVTGFSSCSMQRPQSKAAMGNNKQQMGGGYHGGLNDEQKGAHPRQDNGTGQLDK